MESNRNKRGFTLIELLVAVLIIGILATVALPQYQKAVEKVRVAEAISLLKSLYQASQSYYLTTGDWPVSVRQLDINLSWQGTAEWRRTGEFREGLSNTDWSIQFIHKMEGARGISIGRISGKYKSTGFQIYQIPLVSSIEVGSIYCVEPGSDFYINGQNVNLNGAYCSAMLNGRAVSTSNSALFYKLP